MDNRPGSYALILQATERFELKIGKLGKLPGNAGFYVYCGSAFGPGGVAARVKHHSTISANPHWHIDYLRSASTLTEVWYCHDQIKREHDWSQLLTSYTNSRLPMRGFGSSDCQCNSHLIYFKSRPSLANFRQKIKTHYPDHWIGTSGQPVLRVCSGKSE